MIHSELLERLPDQKTRMDCKTPAVVRLPRGEVYSALQHNARNAAAIIQKFFIWSHLEKSPVFFLHIKPEVENNIFRKRSNGTTNMYPGLASNDFYQ